MIFEANIGKCIRKKKCGNDHGKIIFIPNRVNKVKALNFNF